MGVKSNFSLANMFGVPIWSFFFFFFTILNNHHFIKYQLTDPSQLQVLSATSGCLKGSLYICVLHARGESVSWLY